LSAYSSLKKITHIPELHNWELTSDLEIEIESDCYHIWKPSTNQHIRVMRGTGSCAWGWGALLKRPKSSIVGSIVSLVYPLIGMAFGLKDKLSGD